MPCYLTEAKLSGIKVGIYTDARTRGLRFNVTATSRWFAFRRMVDGKSHDVYIGLTTLEKARELAAKWQAMPGDKFLATVVYGGKEPLKAPLDVIEARRATSSDTMRFRDAMEQYIRFKIEVREIVSRRSIDGIESRLNNHVYPFIGDKPLEEITPADCAKIAQGNWGQMRTIYRALGIVRGCFFWAKAKGWFKGDNPADINGALKYLLPRDKPGLKTPNRGTLPLERIPVFYNTIGLLDRMSVECFRFSILTASRSENARHAAWEEIDFRKKTWTIPASSMKIKSNGSHVVPLSPPAIELLKKIGPRRCGKIFLNPAGETYSDNAFFEIVRDTNTLIRKPFIDEIQSDIQGRTIRATQHGIARAGFKTWATSDANGNKGRYDDAISEMALHHAVPDKYQGAYNRNQYWKSRVKLMDEWAAFVLSSAKVEPLRPAKASAGQSAREELSRSPMRRKTKR